ncbi:MAG TPA: outer membrane protein assembly factor BamC, partial [Burkholderiales bacterium]
MNSTQCVAAVLTALLVLAGCSGNVIEGKKIDYKSAGNVKPLDVPADLSAPPTSDRYNIPDAGASSATASEYAAEAQGPRAAAGPGPVLPPQEKVRFERAGSQCWLVVDAEPDAL